MENKDLLIECIKRDRSGGQQVGLTLSDIKITHVPTGLVVQCGCERSQYSNRKIALAMLEYGLLEIGWNESPN